MSEKRLLFWGLEWYSKNQLAGEDRHPMWATANPHDVGPALFRTRSAARAFRDERWGYIRERPDLRAEPHGWSLPRVTRVEIVIRTLP